MNRVYTAILIIAALGLGALASSYGLRKHPVKIFLLSGEEKAEVHRIELSLMSGENISQPLNLTRVQGKRALEILDSLDVPGLRTFSKDFDEFDVVLGITGTHLEESCSWYLGGGWGALFKSKPEGVFDDLGWANRVYLTFRARTFDPLPFKPAEIQLDDVSGKQTPLETVIPQDPAGTPKSGPLRVEIQNGCGIKGAADWFARRLKGPGTLVTSTGNADHFRYPKTLIKTVAGVPIALEDMLESLGLERDAVEQVPTLPRIANPEGLQTPDVVVIIGKDFRKLKTKIKSGR